MTSFSTASSHCNGDPCQNGGKCTDTGDNFHCDCQNGFTGAICQIGKAQASIGYFDFIFFFCVLVCLIILLPCFQDWWCFESFAFLCLNKQ